MVDEESYRAAAEDLPVHGVPAVPAPRGAGRRSPAGITVGVPWRPLRGSVLGYVGFGPESQLPLTQRVLPAGAVILVLSFDSGSHLLGPAGTLAMSPVSVVGLHDRPTTVEHSGHPRGVAVGLAPPAAYTLLGVAMSELSHTYTGLDALLGEQAWWLLEQLAQARTWEALFGLLDQQLAQWLRDGRPAQAPVVHAWHRLRRSAGRLAVGGLADELGCSRRYLEKRFSEQVGLSPKAVARVWRFQHAARLLGVPGHTLAEIAYLSGYCDQAHLNREFRVLAGCTPTELLPPRPAAQPPPYITVHEICRRSHSSKKPVTLRP
ncbi:helix-turn-helix domain-containing protein [Streptomyces sp. NPDC057638]|uniref:helix-turn-helix transcriptional regulator n=1 Tax=Streptomyces sp. NPDC057638 TaxID=3346190 RepID=UPI003678D1AA